MTGTRMLHLAARETMPWVHRILLIGVMLLAVTIAEVSAATNQEPSEPPLGVEGIARDSADDDPGVLYILPWQPPTLPKRPRARLEDRAPELLEPLDPVALERHRVFRQTLNPSLDSSLSVQ